MAQPAQLIIETLARHRAQIDRDPKRRDRLQAVQRFQVKRLRWTYADCAAQPRYRDALEFFVADLYGPHDHARRDQDLGKVLAQWARLLPERAVDAVSRALEIELLTEALDTSVSDALAGATPDFDTYPAAYRRAGRFDDRRRQIDLILAAGRDLDSLLKIPALGTALRVAHAPARMLGVMELHRFLERGYRAFKQMNGATTLLRTIERRETDIMRRLVQGATDPFGLNKSGKAPP